MMIRYQQHKGMTMNRIEVVPSDKGKFKILRNFIKQGIDYSSKELAVKEAQMLKARFFPTAEIIS